MKKTLLFLMFPLIMLGQTQIGDDIVGNVAEDFQELSISISDNGSIVAIGRPFRNENGDIGVVEIYENVGGVWTQIGNTLIGEVGDEFGKDVSLSGDGTLLAVGAWGFDLGRGRVKVFENVAGVWNQIGQDINGINQGDLSGQSVSLSNNGNIVAIGAPEFSSDIANDVLFDGHVRVFENVEGTWQLIGNQIIGESDSDSSGTSVSLSGDGTIIAIGAPLNDGTAPGSGHTRVYKNVGGTWARIGNDINGEAQQDASGTSVSLSNDGNTVVIGANFNGDGGHARIYENIEGVWTQIGDDIDGEPSDSSGSNVSISHNGNIVAINARFNDANGNNAGKVRIYQNIDGVWQQVGDIDGFENESFGENIMLSGDGSTLIATSSNMGPTRVYDISSILSVSDVFLPELVVYPNPSSQLIHIELPKESTLKSAVMYNALGELVKKSQTNLIDIAELAKGIYYMTITTNTGSATKKIIIN